MSTDLVGLEVGNINPSSIKNLCGCSLMVELQPSKLTTWVRFPSSAPLDNSVRTTRTLNIYQSQKD